MIGRIGAGGLKGKDRSGFIQCPRSEFMQWVTPQAVDFRFGMEITMYIAKR